MLHGTYSLIHADGGEFDDTYTPVVMHDGRLVSVPRLKVAPGSKVTFRSDALISSSLQPHTAVGTRKLLIVPVVWGTKTIKGTQSSDRTFGQGPLTTWYKNASYGQFAWSASATPKVKITAPTGTSVNTWLNQVASRANTKISALGYKSSNYSAVLYETPTLIGRGAAGYGMVPGRYAWVKTPLNIRVAAHELGHTLGLYHAHADECGNQVMPDDVPTFASTCYSVNHECGSSTGTSSTSSWAEYGDPFAAMGESWMQETAKNPNAGSFDAPEKAQLGWVTPGNGRSQQVSHSGSYQLSSYEASTHTAPQAIEAHTANGDYWFEYRTWTGIDTVFQDYLNYYAGQSLPAGVLVHLNYPPNGGGDHGSLLLDTTPAASAFSTACHTYQLASLPGFCDAELQTGQSFVDFQHMVVTASHDAVTGNEVLNIQFDTTTPDVSAMTFTPANGDTGIADQPTLTWTPAADAESGIDYYAVYLDGTRVATVPAGSPLNYQVPTPFVAGSTHAWDVVAVNNVGLVTQASASAFTVN